MQFCCENFLVNNRKYCKLLAAFMKWRYQNWKKKRERSILHMLSICSEIEISEEKKKVDKSQTNDILQIYQKQSMQPRKHKCHQFSFKQWVETLKESSQKVFFYSQQQGNCSCRIFNGVFVLLFAKNSIECLQCHSLMFFVRPVCKWTSKCVQVDGEFLLYYRRRVKIVLK